MGDSPRSPKRRRILTSFNPDTGQEQHTAEPHRRDSRSRSPTEHSRRRREHKTHEHHYDDEPEQTRPRRSRLKLKHEKKTKSSREPRDDDPDSSSTRRRHHHHHHRSRRRHRSPTPPPTTAPNPFEPDALDPDAAFRESLFDAMADDEGAAYWESVYGQPIHVYSNEKAGPAGELEQMTEEEYAAHVRQRMWEKTHAGLLEERARQDEARARKKKEDKHRRKIQEEMEESLRKGEERRRRRARSTRWKDYAAAWAAWDGSVDGIAWPSRSGRRKDVNEPDVRQFFVDGLELEDAGEAPFVAKLREERVRWHPDKIQQKLGGQVDTEVMQSVTAVFQIVDRLWNETRDKA